MLLNVGGVFDLALGDRRLKDIRGDLDSAERHERQVASDEPFLDGRELRLVRLDVDIDVLEPADLLALAVDEHPAMPLSNIPLSILLLL